jgi:hypothetical protein
LEKSACHPVAVLRTPVVLEKSACHPVAVLLKPVVLERSAECPVAVLRSPVVLEMSASIPVAVLKACRAGFVVPITTRVVSPSWMLARAVESVLATTTSSRIASTNTPFSLHCPHPIDPTKKMSLFICRLPFLPATVRNRPIPTCWDRLSEAEVESKLTP